MSDTPTVMTNQERMAKARAVAFANRAARKAAEAAAYPPQPSVAEQAIPVQEAVSADVSLVQDAPEVMPQEPNSYAQEIERIRKVRKPFGAFRQKLALPVRPQYHRHWFNDVPGRVDEAIAGGWTHVTDSEGKPIRRVVGTGRDKGALYAYAMELPLIFWEEDQAAKLERAKSAVAAIKASPFRAQQGSSQKADQGKFYSPAEEVITVTKGS